MKKEDIEQLGKLADEILLKKDLSSEGLELVNELRRIEVEMRKAQVELEEAIKSNWYIARLRARNILYGNTLQLVLIYEKKSVLYWDLAHRNWLHAIYLKLAESVC
ncbi:hypothetical protein COU57_05475 [Candidatus Pacearchaeota archaeon CG10_big_fil_rev_8_21_14_0_10_32_14]|nr:MAG: hypothetical protein COU57_05475 [Candidatus Pacearchaeota archaeon CG10_big_fil_rev_8_21_14_0_10_32_14]